MSDDLGIRKIGRRRRTTRRLTRRPLRVPSDEASRSGAPSQSDELFAGEDLDGAFGGERGFESEAPHEQEPEAEDRRSVDEIEVQVDSEADGENAADGPTSGVMQAPERRAELLPPPAEAGLRLEMASSFQAAVAGHDHAVDVDPPDEKTNPKIRLSDPVARRTSPRPPVPPPPAVASEPPDAPTRPRIEISHEMAMLAGRVTTLEMPPLPGEESDADTNPRMRAASSEPPSSSVLVSRAQMVSDGPPSSAVASEIGSSVFEDTREPASLPTLTGVAVELPAYVDEIETIDLDDESAEARHARTSKAPPPPPSEAAAKSQAKKAAPPPPPPTSAKKAPPAKAPAGPKRRQWWDDFFSDDYLQSVLPPSAAQVRRQVDFVEQSLGLPKGAAVLDVGCGTGGYALELARRGYLVVALDLSLPMITRAAEEAQQEGLRINFLHTDMREIAFESMFDAILCVGTSLGFFDDESNRDVLARLLDALKPQGRIFLDVVNRDHVVHSQPNLVWFEGEGCVVMEESDFNYFTSRLSVKRTMMREDGRQSEAEYSLRLYSLHELGQLLHQVGFRVNEVSGQEATRGVFFGTNSPRIVLLAERRAPKEAGKDRVTQVTTEQELPRTESRDDGKQPS